MAAVVLGGVLAAAGCQFPEVPPIDAPVGHLVGGTVDGLWTGASLVLRLEVPGRAPQTVTVDREGTFAFPERLPALTSFALGIESDAVQHTCQVETPSGQVGAVDVTDLTVRCTSQIAITVALSTLTPFTFDPQLTRQELDVSTLLGSLSITVGGPAGTAAMVNGSPAPIGAPSAAVDIAMGESTINIDVIVAPLSRTYQLVLNRGASQPLEYFYAKAPSRDAGDRFGWAVDADAGFIAIGAPAEDSATQFNPANADADASGAVIVFRRNDIGSFFLKGANIVAGQHLGSSVAIDSDVVVGGAPDVGPGAALVWRWNGQSWLDEQRLLPPGGAAGDQYGYAVDVFDDTIAVSAPGASDGGMPQRGLVYIYRHNGSAWTQEAVIRAPNQAIATYFGYDLRLGADRLVVSSPDERSAAVGTSAVAAVDTGAPGSGAAYVFHRTGTTWQLESYIKASNTGASDSFGWSVDLSDDVLAVGAIGEDGGGTAQQDDSMQSAGAVYVFRRIGNAWAQEAYVKASSPVTSTQFGYDVAIRRDTLAVGAWEAAPEINGPGSVHVFGRTDAVWVLQSRLGASNAEPGDEFTSVALWQDGLVVGADGESGLMPGDNDAPYAGAAYFFR